ncbi:MAG: 50S ribosomal protein L11 methyltransferase [Puniceicoccales bacterium]|jgi:ribosomal protein L11 methyltransferase|nr:50S ribosomal protein L11 methyltransferase [Puniceicoccales bacterium]
MLKFSSKISSRERANAIGEFLSEKCLIRWTIEADAASGECYLCGYVEDEASGKSDFVRIKEECGGGEEPSVASIDATDWENAYKRFAKPWRCENLHWIPAFMEGEVDIPDGDVAVCIDPGMAFGSGSHETTRLCAKAMVMFKNLYEKTGDLGIKDCIDVGCGSGILGISAIKLGLAHVTFIDIDESALRISRENAEQNGLFPDQMDFAAGDLRISILGRQTDLLVANILTDVLVQNADLLVSSVRSGGLLCLSGILKKEKAEVVSIFGKLVKKKWESAMENFIEDGEWVALAYFRG